MTATRNTENDDTLVEELTETVRLHEAFAGVLAHDLRNPLGAIMTSAQLVLGREQDERVRKPLMRIMNSGKRMASLIEQLLDFTQARSHEGFSLAKQRTNTCALCEQVAADLEPTQAERVRVEGVGDVFASCDPDRLSRAIFNLIANALAYGKPEGTVDVRLEGGSRDIEIRVRNMGTIEPMMLQRLFDPLSNMRDRRNRRGLGVGLFITRKIIVAHGGSIDCVSAEETGSTVFTIRLPR